MSTYAYCSNLTTMVSTGVYTVDTVLNPQNTRHAELIAQYTTVVQAELSQDPSMDGTCGNPEAVLLVSLGDGNYDVRFKSESDRMPSYRTKAKAINSQYLTEFKAAGCLTTVTDANENCIRMNCDYLDITNMQGVAIIMQAQAQESTLVRDFYNQFHNLTLAQVNQIVTDLFLNGQQGYYNKWTREQQINAATSKAELEAIVGPLG